jgi:hypothetical protein
MTATSILTRGQATGNIPRHLRVFALRSEELVSSVKNGLQNRGGRDPMAGTVLSTHSFGNGFLR